MSENLCKRDPEVADANENTAVLMILEYLYIYIYIFFLLYACPTENLFFPVMGARSKPQGYRADMFNPFRTHLEYPREICTKQNNLYQKLLKSCCPQDGVLRDQAFARPVFFQCLKVS